ncbi:MAG: D-alanyl-D-alanine carboxypeptidase/D-alanyl-D-alanine-endopeptidase [Burkholderiaceae bacterium]|nr:D-alanyl-D-alanine carboxypeptidase/D-alanyl-D-alanine-endopeptidase [Burkholderiaceae bacterium]
MSLSTLRWCLGAAARGRPLVAGVLLAGSLAVANVAAQALPPELAAAWRATKLPESSISLVVQEIGGGRLVSINPSAPRNPASVMKMVTTWAGLSGLGPEYTWRTTLLAKGGGKVDAQGTLSGPLYIKAAGDPFLTVKDLWNLLRELRLRGIKNLTEVVVDRSVFGQVGIDPGAFDGAADRPYNASPDAMMVGLGAVRLIFQPDAQAKKWVAIVDPPVPGLRVNGDVAWSPAVCPGSPAVNTQITPMDREIVVNVSGTAAGSCGEFSVYRLAQSQTDYFTALFQMLWKEQGGTLAKGISAGRVPAGVEPIVWHHSDSLANIIRQINKQSNNVMARSLLLTLAAERTGPGATAQAGANAALAVLQQQNVNTQGWVIDNGAGLSREARLTADGLATMLDTAWRSSLMPEFMSSLAISGVDGTVRRRMRNSEAQGMAHLKTGTLRDARALAGYVLGASGKRYILVSMVNDERSVAVRPFDDALVKWLASM